MKTPVLLLVLLVIVLAVSSGCSALQFNAAVADTPTPSRTPRPTFTPKPSATLKPSLTPTLAPTDTPEAPPTALASDTPTKKAVVVTPRPTSIPATPRPTQPPAPSFLVNVISDPKTCPSSNYEIDVRVGKTNSGPWVGGYTMALFDKAGNLLKNGAGNALAFVSLPDNQVMTRTWGGCPRPASNDSPLPYNGKIDAGDAVKMGTKSMTFRFVKSLSDLTAISPDQDIDFSGSKEYWLYYKAP